MWFSILAIRLLVLFHIPIEREAMMLKWYENVVIHGFLGKLAEFWSVLCYIINNQCSIVWTYTLIVCFENILIQTLEAPISFSYELLSNHCDCFSDNLIKFIDVICVRMNLYTEATYHITYITPEINSKYNLEYKSVL